MLKLKTYLNAQQTNENYLEDFVNGISSSNAKLVNRFNVDDLANMDIGSEVYINAGSAQYHVQSWRGSLKITDITMGLHTGKKAKQYTVYANLTNDVANLVANVLHKFDVKDIHGIFATIGDFAETGRGKDYYMDDLKDTVTYREEEEPTKELMNPWNLAKVKKLTSFPSKFKRADLIKVLVNGQYDVITTNGKYTDDYAYDNSINYGEGNTTNPTELLRLLYMFSSKSFYISSNEIEGEKDKLAVGLSFASSQYYTVVVNLKAKHRVKL